MSELPRDERLLVLTPTGRDAELVVQTLQAEKLSALRCADVHTFMRRLAEGAAAGIVAEEAMKDAVHLQQLDQVLQHQAPWSDFPLILIAWGEQSARHSAARYRTFQRLGNLTILERPFHRETLLIAAQSALRNRHRQYEARAHLEERQHAAEELERRVAERTRTLAETQEALHQAQKLEAIGRLAGGVAHDFNNLMTGIQGIAEDLASQFSPGAPEKADLDEILKATGRASALTKQLLAFGRKQVIAPQVLDLNHAVDNMKPLLLRLMREDIALRLVLEPAVGNIWIDRSNFEQILINLVMNARDAMVHGGTLTIETRSIENAGSPPRYVRLDIRDTGMGMSHDIMQQVFEPFFTTKGVGKGTGLGLATVYGHVKQSNGDITVSSEAGKGTTMTITWPVVALPAQSARGAFVQAPKGSETILVVEDEDIVRSVAVRTLKRQGYRVLEASNGAAALKLAADPGLSIDLLLADVVMPEMDGWHVAQALTATRPKLVVLFMSAHTEDVIMHKGVLNPGVSFLEKPFNAESLSRKVRAVLDRELNAARLNS